MSALFQQVVHLEQEVLPYVEALSGTHGTNRFRIAYERKSFFATERVRLLLGALCCWAGEWAAPTINLSWRTRSAWDQLLTHSPEKCSQEIDGYVSRIFKQRPHREQSTAQMTAVVCAVNGLQRLSAILWAQCEQDLAYGSTSAAHWNLAERRGCDEAPAIELVGRLWSRLRTHAGLDIDAVPELFARSYWILDGDDVALLMTRWSVSTGVVDRWRPALLAQHRRVQRRDRELADLLRLNVE